MAERLQLVIAGLGIELAWEGARLADEPARQLYEPFLTSGRVDLALRIHCGSLPSVAAEEVLFDGPEGGWRLSRANDHYLFEIFDTVPPHPKVEVALVEGDLRAGEVYLQPQGFSHRPTWSLVRLMRPLGELLLIQHLAQRGQGVMVHGCGIEDRGQGLLFVGRSGSGKTTLANLYRAHSGARVLGDERVIVRRGEDGFLIAGTPWPGSFFETSAEPVCLRRIFFLEHAQRNLVIPDGLTNLLGLLFQQLFLPRWHRESLGFALEFAEALLTSIPTARLGFVNTPEVVAFLRREVLDAGQH